MAINTLTNDEARVLLAEFILETDEIIEYVESDLIEFEKNGDKDFLNRIFRAFYTVKRNAEFLNQKSIVELVHLCEELLGRLRDGVLELDKKMISALLEAKDELGIMIKALDESRTPDRASEDTIGKLGEVLGLSREDSSLQEKVHNENGRRKRFLVVEDDFISRSILNTFLAQYALIDVAVSGEEAVDIFRRTMDGTIDWRYDLICMDIVMPQLNGLEATRRIRELEKENNVDCINETTIIMVSGMNDPRTVIKSLYRNGANAFITKPIDLKKLQKELKIYKLIV